MLLDTLFKGSCEMDSLDDIIPLMEVLERYQIKKELIQQRCDEAILAQLNSNILDKLSTLVNVMSEESIKKAVDITMMHCKKNFTQFRHLPEKILCHLLQRNDIATSEIDIYRYF